MLRQYLLPMMLWLTVVAGPLPASASEALPDTWQVVQAVGDVTVSDGPVQQVALQPKAVVHGGARVRTGNNGRAVLVRGDEQVILEQRSEIVLTTSSGLVTRVRQAAGSAMYAVGKRRAPHFEVTTPYLAALVKGTAFRIQVDGAATRVDVTHGVVEVSSNAGSAVTLLRAGASAVVRALSLDRIDVMKGSRVLRSVTRNEGGWDGNQTTGASADPAAGPGSTPPGAGGPGGGPGSGGGSGSGLPVGQGKTAATTTTLPLVATAHAAPTLSAIDGYESSLKAAGKMVSGKQVLTETRELEFPVAKPLWRGNDLDKLPAKELALCAIGLLSLMIGSAMFRRRRHKGGERTVRANDRATQRQDRILGR